MVFLHITILQTKRIIILVVHQHNYDYLNSILVKLIGTGCVGVSGSVQCFVIPQYMSF